MWPFLCIYLVGDCHVLPIGFQDVFKFWRVADFVMSETDFNFAWLGLPLFSLVFCP